jgi:hypothetical protein
MSYARYQASGCFHTPHRSRENFAFNISVTFIGIAKIIDTFVTSNIKTVI